MCRWAQYPGKCKEKKERREEKFRKEKKERKEENEWKRRAIIAFTVDLLILKIQKQ